MRRRNWWLRLTLVLTCVVALFGNVGVSAADEWRLLATPGNLRILRAGGLGPQTFIAPAVRTELRAQAAQITVEYDGSRPVRVEAVIVSAQHSSLVKIETIREDILEKVIHAVVPPSLLDSRTKYFINPTGRFVVGGPQGDCGVTGRKIIVDTYGGVGSHGGGAFSGKDPTKVDRSASYMARHIAKNIVAAGLADHLELQIAYAIGVPEPVSVMADTLGSGKVEEARLVEAIREIFPLTHFLRITRAVTPGNFAVLYLDPSEKQNAAKKHLAAFSINTRPEECQLDRVGVETIEKLLGEDSVLPVGRTANLEERLQQRWADPLELAPVLLILLLLLLAGESLLANKFYRAAPPEGPAA